MKTNALQAEYENINLGIMSSYLSLLHNTKIAVLKTLEDFVKEADLNLEPNKIDILQSKLDIDIDQIFNLIAENDAIGFSINPITIFRHEVLGIAKTLSGSKVILNKKVAFYEDPNLQGLENLTLEQSISRVYKLISKRVEQLKKLN